jgi:hypothetical protein
VDGTSSWGSCTLADWQNQWNWETDGTEVASTVAARLNACVANFTTGQLLVFGGLVDASASNESWVFDPHSGNGWRSTTGITYPKGRWAAACFSEGSVMYMHGGASDDVSALSDLWVFNITNLSWSEVLPSSCNSNLFSCSFAARSHVLIKYTSFLYAWDTLEGRFARFSLASSAWESLIAPSFQRFHRISVAQISTRAFVSLGLATDSASNLLHLITFSSSGDPVNFVALNASRVPLVVGGCMLAFSSRVLVLGGKPASSANRYRCLAFLLLPCLVPYQLTPRFSCSSGKEYGFWMNFDATNEDYLEPVFGTPLCGPLPANIGPACTILNNSVVSIGGFDCSSAQSMEVQLRAWSLHFLDLLSLSVICTRRSSLVEPLPWPSCMSVVASPLLGPPPYRQVEAL